MQLQTKWELNKQVFTVTKVFLQNNNKEEKADNKKHALNIIILYIINWML